MMRFGPALALLALALKLLMPPGYMPGPSLAQPVMLCPDQGPAPAAGMAHHGHHQPVKPPHGQAEHPCAYAGIAAASLLADLDGPATVLPTRSVAVRGIDRTAAAPGRGMAAPPPPSHAPPLAAA